MIIFLIKLFVLLNCFYFGLLFRVNFIRIVQLKTLFSKDFFQRFCKSSAKIKYRPHAARYIIAGKF